MLDLSSTGRLHCQWQRLFAFRGVSARRQRGSSTLDYHMVCIIWFVSTCGGQWYVRDVVMYWLFTMIMNIMATF